MQRRTAIVAAFLCASVPAWGQAPKQNDENDGATMLTKARDATNFDSTSTMPFRLRGRVTFFDGHNKAIHGDLTFLFESRERWRREISWNGQTDTTVAAQGRLWRSGPEIDRIKEMRLDLVMHFSERLLTLADGKPSVAHAKEVGGVACRCVKLTRGNFNREVCVDTTNGLPVRARDATMEVEVVGGNYRAVGLKRFPAEIQYSEHGKQMFQMSLDSLDELGTAAEDAFAPIPGTSPTPWCPDEKGARIEHFGSSNFAILMFVPSNSPMWSGGLRLAKLPQSKFQLLIFAVSADGHVKDLKAYDRHGVLVEHDSDVEKLRNSTFYPAICGDRVVESEVVLVVPRP